MGEANPGVQKVVVNRCFGGFGVSVEALSELLDMECPHIKSDAEDKYFGADSYCKTVEDRNRHVEMCGLLRRNGMIYSDGHSGYGEHQERACEHLVALIEVWGSERVSGQHAELEIVEIPAGVQWQIGEYDGMESVEEAHRTW